MGSPGLESVYASADEFLAVFAAELSKGGLLVRGAAVGALQAMSECQVTVKVAGRTPVTVPARVAAVVPGVGVAVMFEGVPADLQRLADRLKAGTPDEAPAEPADDADDAGPPGLVADRIRALTTLQKMALAVSGTREERFALMRDQNKVLHVYVLKNPRIGLDEVTQAAKMPSFSPDALKMIAENREWSSNASVLSALVRNPRTPLPIALQLIDRLPLGEVRALAKGGAREQIVHAARRRVSG